MTWQYFLSLCFADTKVKNILWSMPKYVLGAREQGGSSCIIFRDLGNMSKIILGNRGKYFRGAGGDLGIIFRKQGSQIILIYNGFKIY